MPRVGKKTQHPDREHVPRQPAATRLSTKETMLGSVLRWSANGSHARSSVAGDDAISDAVASRRKPATSTAQSRGRLCEPQWQCWFATFECRKTPAFWPRKLTPNIVMALLCRVCRSSTAVPGSAFDSLSNRGRAQSGRAVRVSIKATPPGVRTGTNVHSLRPCCVTVRPLIVPIAAPNTTSLA